MEVDYASVSAHKFHGPKGIGCLYRRAGAPFSPLLFGGGQEYGLRSGTENVPGIIGFGAAARAALRHLEEDAGRLSRMRDSSLFYYEQLSFHSSAPFMSLIVSPFSAFFGICADLSHNLISAALYSFYKTSLSR